MICGNLPLIPPPAIHRSAPSPAQLLPITWSRFLHSSFGITSCPGPRRSRPQKWPISRLCPAVCYNRLPPAPTLPSLLLVSRRISVQRPPGRPPSTIGYLVCRTVPISLHVSLHRDSSSLVRITRPLSSCICPAVLFFASTYYPVQSCRSCIVTPSSSLADSRDENLVIFTVTVTVSASRFECIPILISDMPTK